jgi:hypothetical protein
MSTAATVLSLVVRTYTVFNVPTADMAIAKHLSANILKRAGVGVVWIDCGRDARVPAPPTCLEPLESGEVMMRIASGTGHQHESIATEALGSAYVDTEAAVGSLATAYADRIARMASAAGLDVGTLLGLVMAHEIGHMLLGTNAHRPEGLMRAEWSPLLLQHRFARDWEFSSDEINRLTRNLAFRIRNSELAQHSSTAEPTTSDLSSFMHPDYQPTCRPLVCSSSQVFSGAK